VLVSIYYSPIREFRRLQRASGGVSTNLYKPHLYCSQFLILRSGYLLIGGIMYLVSTPGCLSLQVHIFFFYLYWLSARSPYDPAHIFFSPIFMGT